ncbi:MAG: FAD:protein FMN transferase [Candidatus Krumholzibacteriota bacterium]
MIRLLALTLLVWSGAVASAEEQVSREQVRYVMGTTATVRAWAPDAESAALAVEAAYAAFARTDSLMSTWRDDSVLSRLNRSVAGHWVEVGPEVCGVLDEAKRVAEASKGAFDPTVLPLVRLWGFRDGDVALPDAQVLDNVLHSVGHDLLELDLPGGRARLLTQDAAVDLGGIAKGHALEQAARAMQNAGAGSGVVDLGGNILVFGPATARQVGIVDPRREDRLLAAVLLTDAAVATSGQYERFLTIEGRRYGHILDPRSGWPVPSGISVTVVAGRAILADALATAAVVLGPDDGLALLERISGVEGVLAVPDGRGGLGLKTTSGYVPVPESPGTAHGLQSCSKEGKAQQTH